MEIEKMTLEQLKELQAQIKEEIASRESISNKLVVYTHDCKDSSRYHLNKYKHWSKLVKSVDTTKTNGYAFNGEFLNVNYEHKLPVGSIIAEVCGETIKVYKIDEDGFDLIAEGKTNRMSGLIEKVAVYFE